MHADGLEVWALLIERGGWPRQVAADMRERDQLGRARYLRPLRVWSDRSSLQDAYEEALDLLAYLTQARLRCIDATGEEPSSLRLLADITAASIIQLRHLLDQAVVPPRRPA